MPYCRSISTQYLRITVPATAHTDFFNPRPIDSLRIGHLGHLLPAPTGYFLRIANQARPINLAHPGIDRWQYGRTIFNHTTNTLGKAHQGGNRHQRQIKPQSNPLSNACTNPNACKRARPRIKRDGFQLGPHNTCLAQNRFHHRQNAL